MAVGLTTWLVGCGSSLYEGTWVGQREVEGPKHIVGTAGRIELTLRKDARYELLIHSLPVQGTYAVVEGKIELTPKTVAGRNVIPGEGESLFGEGAYATVEGENLAFNDVRGPDRRTIRLKKKPAANPDRNP